MTTTAKSFTRTVYGNDWTITVDLERRTVSASRAGVEREGHRYPAWRTTHEVFAGKIGMLRVAAVMVNRLRSASDISFFLHGAAYLEGRRGHVNVNSWRWNHRGLPGALAANAVNRANVRAEREGRAA